jgi:hypothetical protein
VYVWFNGQDRARGEELMAQGNYNAAAQALAASLGLSFE